MRIGLVADTHMPRFGRRKIRTVAGVRIGMVHGDGTQRTTLERALGAFEPGSVDVVAFGHSHTPYLERWPGRWVMNPGSPTDKRRNPAYSYGLIRIDAGEVWPSLHYYDRK